jgi:hypothetical protein
MNTRHVTPDGLAGDENSNDREDFRLPSEIGRLETPGVQNEGAIDPGQRQYD